MSTAEQKLTSVHVVEAVERHLSKGTPDTWVFMREARSGAGFAGNDGRCDLLAFGTWASSGHIRVGVEVKVSRADWVNELKRPEKCERFYRYCHRWYLAVPAPWKRIVLDDLPGGWGLMEVGARGVKVIVPSPTLVPVEPPWSWTVGWMATLDRRQRAVDNSVEQRVAAAAVARAKTEWEAGSSERHTRAAEVVEQKRVEIREFIAALGIDPTDRVWAADREAFIRLWQARTQVAHIMRAGIFDSAIRELSAIVAVRDALEVVAS